MLTCKKSINNVYSHYGKEVNRMGISQNIRILLVKCGNLSEAELARRMGISPQNLSYKMKRDNFATNDLIKVTKALGCNLEIAFVLPDGEKVATTTRCCEE